MQELACRAYSLQQLASSIPGWRLLGPMGQLMPVTAPAAVAKLLHTLVQQQQQGKPHQHGQEEARAKPDDRQQQLQEIKRDQGGCQPGPVAAEKRKSLEQHSVPQIRKRKKKQQALIPALDVDQQQLQGHQPAKAESGTHGISKRAAGLRASLAGASRSRKKIAKGHANVPETSSDLKGHEKKKKIAKSRLHGVPKAKPASASSV